MATELDRACSFAIAHARERGRTEADAGDLLTGALRAISRFGVAQIGPYVIDLEELRIDWSRPVERSAGKVAWSDDAVAVFDCAARIARSDRQNPDRPMTSARVQITHLLVAIFTTGGTLMTELQQRYGITSAGWRTALAVRPSDSDQERRETDGPATPAEQSYLSPEEVAQALGIHVQTVRGYIRSGKLTALRVAGERTIRIRKSDIESLLEPLHPED